MPCDVLLITQEPRRVSKKLSCGASESFDSALLKRLRGLCHLFVKKMFATRDECVGGKSGFSQALCFSPQSHQASTVSAERQSGSSTNLGTKKAGPLNFSIRQCSANAACWHSSERRPAAARIRIAWRPLTSPLSHAPSSTSTWTPSLSPWKSSSIQI